MSAKKRNHDRAPGQCSISFSCSEEMKKAISELAQKDRRTVSNYLQVVIADHLEKIKTK